MRKFDIDKVSEMVTQGYLIKQKHPTEDLHIYNYSQLTQYSGYWNDITLACRGLILDSKGNIHASTFDKFFNYGQKEAIISAEKGFIAYEKMDGSYIGTYWIGDEVYLNTKGSFTFVYVEMATHIMNTQYSEAKKRLDPAYTYVFEIIFPAGRIVCDYGDRLDLVLLAVFNIETGREMPLSFFDYLGFSQPHAEYFPDGTLADIEALMSRNIQNKEGYVIKFNAMTASGGHARVKVKFEEYVRYHRIITNVTSYDIYDALRTNNEIPEEILECVPDEFYDWVRNYETKLYKQYANIAESVFFVYDLILISFMPKDFSRSDLFNQVQLHAPSITSEIMCVYDLKFVQLKKLIWRSIKPPLEKPSQLVGKQLGNYMSEVLKVEKA